MTHHDPAQAGSATPRGLGMYLGRIAREWTPAQERAHADKAKRARVRHVALCAEALDGWQAPHAALVDAAEAYRDAGCQVWVYSLPGERALAEPGTAVVDRLVDAAVACAARGRILDAEESYAHRSGTLLSHVERLTERSTERDSLGVTLYGTPTHGVRGYPWAAVSGWGWLGWQCYERAGTRQRVRRDLAELRQRWGADVVPHLATYARRGATAEGKDGAARLLGDINRTCLDDEGRCDVPGLWLWQEATLDGAEADVLAAWSERQGW